MAEFKDPACADAILPLVKHAHAFVRMGALRALKELRRKDTLKPALEALRDSDAAVRVQAIGVIGFLKLEESIPALTASTGDPDAHVRRAAVSALAFSQMKPAAESITRTLGDEDWMVREMAAETIGPERQWHGRGGPVDCRVDGRFLAGAAQGDQKPRQDENRPGRPSDRQVHHPRAGQSAQGSCGGVGRDCRSGRGPFLVLVANDPDPEVRKNARWALQQIVARKAKTSS